jgi:rare lipoprotein A
VDLGSTPNMSTLFLKIMKKIALIMLVMATSTFAQEKGIASYYSEKGNRKTASGERFSPDANTAAHKTLKFGTMVKVTNLNNQKSVIVRINDRGPFIRGRVIDLTPKTAKELGFYSMGLTKVLVEVIGD